MSTPTETTMDSDPSRRHYFKPEKGPQQELPKLPDGARVIYLRKRDRTPVGCVVYQEFAGKDGSYTVTCGWSSLAHSDENSEKVVLQLRGKQHVYRIHNPTTPCRKTGRSFAIWHFGSPVDHRRCVFNFTPAPEDIRTSKEGRTSLYKEAVLKQLLIQKQGTETFRSRVKNHLKFAALRLAEKKGSEKEDKQN